jgi:hypothetical protein
MFTSYFEANWLKFFIRSIEHVIANRGVMTGWTFGYWVKKTEIRFTK